MDIAMGLDQMNLLSESASLNKLKNSEDTKLKETCQDFESIMMNQLMQVMRKTLTGDELLGGGYESEMYRSMYDEYLTKKLASEGSTVGISDLLYDQLKVTGSK